MGELTVVDQVLTLWSQLLQSLWFGFHGWLLHRLWVGILLLYVVDIFSLSKIIANMFIVHYHVPSIVQTLFHLVLMTAL